MSFQLVGQAVGSFFGPIGSFVGGVIGGLIDRSTADGPSPGDLSAPGLQLGRQLPRVYGRVRLPVNPIWASAYRATEHGGKGPPAGPSSFTYSLDILGAICDGTNVLAVTRIWVNKKLVYTALADSSDASVQNSQDTDYWSSFTLKTGGPAQTPWSVYEDAVTAANAPAYRNLCTIGFADLQCGSSKTPPAIEVEVITNGTSGSVQLYEPQIITGGAYDDTLPGNDVEHLVIPRPAGAWYLEIRDYVYESSDNTANNNIVTWEGNNGSGIYRINVYNENTWGELKVSFNNLQGYNTGLNGSAANGTIKLEHLGGGSVRLLLNGAVLWTDTVLSILTGSVNVQDTLEVGDPEPNYTVANKFSVSQIELYPSPAGTISTWTPETELLSDIVSAELQLNPEVPSTDFDVTDLTTVEVIGYTAAGSPAKTCQELCDIHYADVVPGNPIVFQRRGTAAIATIPFIDTGVGSDGPADGFTGLKRGNADERPAVAAIRFPLLERDHEAGYERGDRLATDADDVRTIETRVVMSATTAKGRAITATLLDRVRTHTANFALSDKYASREPADVDTVVDDDGNSYRLRITRFAYADGVKSCEWELDDTTALVETGLTGADYTPSIEIVAPGDAEVLPLDIPLQRVQDDDPGYLAAVKCSDDSRVYFLESPNDTTYTEVAQFPIDAVFGTVISINGTPSLVATDTGCELVVDVGDGTLSSITDTTLLLDTASNRFKVGLQGREVIGQFRDATLDSDGYYTLSGFLWGLNGTSQYVDDLASGDSFCLLNESGGVKHIDRTNPQLNVQHYIKAVPERRTQASIVGEAFTNTGVALKPLPGINPHADRDATSGDITITWDRQTRYPTRFGGDLGDSCPLGEESERYQVRLYTSNTFATLVREFDVVTTAEVTYTSAQRSTDSHTPITASLYVDVRQISATVGEGYALQATL